VPGVTEAVRIPTPDGGSLAGALALPDGAGPFPGVIVLHEIFGVNDDMRRITDRFASNGYAALAPDLYSHGNRALCLSRVLLAAASSSAMKATLADIEAARQELARHPAVDEHRIAVVGFCLGGGFALLVGAEGGVKAAGVNYGSVPKDKGVIADVCPVVASYGDQDRPFVAHARRLERHLEELGVPHDVKIYEGVGHSFLSYDNAPAWAAKLPSPLKAGYSEQEAEDAWTRMLAFFDEHVRS
jgi:carboxymethylenebutenolidase